MFKTIVSWSFHYHNVKGVRLDEHFLSLNNPNMKYFVDLYT
ncbi:hypothetical protein BSBH6_00082 [Bacillus subtilis]|nr:hypothetical protein BSBH6_00082 [Bacillus subtilis]RPK26446.1 hypothetical protein BH5_00081 [Bacillus subtilis]